MKNLTSALLLSVIVSSLSSAAFANDKEEGPCRKIRDACEAGGFKKGDHKNGKGLFVDCMKKIMAGESVEGVTVPADEVAACKAKKEKHKERREEKKAEKEAAKHG